MPSDCVLIINVSREGTSLNTLPIVSTAGLPPPSTATWPLFPQCPALSIWSRNPHQMANPVLQPPLIGVLSRPPPQYGEMSFCRPCGDGAGPDSWCSGTLVLPTLPVADRMARR